jgi:hypothetical protein
MLRKIENLEELAGLKIVSITEMPFIHSSRFENEKEAINSYDAVQQILRDQDGDLGISAYRLLQNWQEEPPSNKPWFVIVLGETPPGPVATQLVEIINQGETTLIPDEVIAKLAKIRLDNMEKLQDANKTYLERHYTPN